MYAMSANFRPVEEKNGHIGYADITVGNALRIHNISVFEKDGERNLAFAKFGKDNERSYVIPASKEAYAAMLNVVSTAVDSKDHFAYVKGDYNVRFEVSGAKVEEPYADARFSVAVGDLCTLNGISTRVVEYNKDGKDAKFTAVDLPVSRNAEGEVSKYTDNEGKEHVNLQYEPLVNTWKDNDGQEQKRDYAALLNNLVRAKRKELLAPSLDDKIAEGKAAETPEKGADAPAREDQVR